MSNKMFLSSFMLIRIHVRNRFHFILPVSFWVIEDTLSSVSDLLWIIQRPFKLFAGKTCHQASPFFFWSGEIFSLIDGVIYELRKYGKLQLVQVDTEDAKVSIDLI